ncbi:MAG: hypothetical protein L6R36_001293 [Xanthoria steineri]|nr:MAG: hypothetical protein L6R36_001293 [Xanthoria steineri]
MQDQWKFHQQTGMTAELLFGAMPPRNKSKPIICLPPTLAKNFQHETQVPSHQLNDKSSFPSDYTNQHGDPTSLTATEPWKDRFKRLTGKAIDQQHGLPSPPRYDAIDDPIKDTKSKDTKSKDTKSKDIKSKDTKAKNTKAKNTKAKDTKANDIKSSSTKSKSTKSRSTKSRSTKSSSNTATEAVVPDEHNYDHQMSSTSTPPSTIAETMTASVSSQTAALLMEGAKVNWKNTCESLLEVVSLEDKEILEQIALLVGRLGTGSGPLNLAHRPHFAPYEGITAINVGTASVFTGRLVEENGIGGMVKDADVQQTNEEKEARKEEEEEKEEEEKEEEEKEEEEKEEDEAELQARKERIATSLRMRRQEQPIKKYKTIQAAGMAMAESISYNSTLSDTVAE